MNPIIEITTPDIFENKKIISGVTRRNLRLFPEIGFNITSSEIISADEVIKHKQVLADNLSLPLEKCIFQKQVHGDRIDIITNNHQIVERDGMISNIKEIILNINIADCCAVLFHDPVNEAVGAVHSGWKGTKLNISSKAIAMMTQEFASDPNDLKVYLS
ncbi:MAG: laccase domain-containing protein, partial [Chlorobi bacterium]|nr:laccase domain-containing protein [Chlorobiota bacterium]